MNMNANIPDEYWKVVYQNENATKVWRGKQSFKTEYCARRGVNVLESGYVLGFVRLDDFDMVLLDNPIEAGLYYKETGLYKEFQ